MFYWALMEITWQQDGGSGTIDLQATANVSSVCPTQVPVPNAPV